MLSREDILRELELLPVWQLRRPTPAERDVAAENKQQASDNPVEKAETVEPCRYIFSKDRHWIFVLPSQHSAAAEQLLKNMLNAVKVDIGQDATEANIASVPMQEAQVVVAMGEQQAQALLSVEKPLAQLRGQAHDLQNTNVIVTYTPAHLLANAQDKAKAWQDLCLAKFTIANL